MFLTYTSIFSISDEVDSSSLHYDVLTQRPPSANRIEPLDYLYMEDNVGAFKQPDLKPEKTIDYELGFVKKLTFQTFKCFYFTKN